MRQNEPAGPVCVTWRVKNVLGQLTIPCLFKHTEVLFYYLFLSQSSLHGVPVISKHWNRDGISSLPDYFPGW